MTTTGISLVLQKFKIFKQSILKFLASLLLVDVLSNFSLLLGKVSLKLIFPEDVLRISAFLPFIISPKFSFFGFG